MALRKATFVSPVLEAVPKGSDVFKIIELASDHLHFPDMLTDDTEAFQDKIHLHSSVCQVPINFTFLFQEPHTQSNFPFLVKRGLFTTVKLPCNDSLYKSIGSVVVNKTTL